MVKEWIPGFFFSYWKRRCLIAEQEIKRLEIEIAMVRLSERVPLSQEEVAEFNRRTLGAEFHSEVKL